MGESLRAILVQVVLVLSILGSAPKSPALSGAADPPLLLRMAASGEMTISSSANGPWATVGPGDRIGGYTVLCVASGGEPWAVLEREDDTSGEFRFVASDGATAVITKPFGKVGRQPPPEIVERSAEQWRRLLEAQNDVLGESYLADPRDPSYARTAQFTAPLQFPESYVGMREFPHEVHVAWDGSVGLDPGLFTGKEWNTCEFASALPFALNGREIDPSESLGVLRGQLEHYLPAAQYVYHRRAEQVGWEEIVFMGQIEETAGLFLRFRLVNLSDRPQTVSFSIHQPAGGEINIQRDRISVTAPFPRVKPGTMPDDPEAAAEKQRQINQKVFSVTLLASEPAGEEDALPVWRFNLAKEDAKDLYLFLPGSSAAAVPAKTLNPDEIKPAFFRALKTEYDRWQAFFARGIQLEIPEPMVEEVYRGVTAKVLVCVDGDEVRGGAVHYEGFWPYCALSVVRVMLDLGYDDEARRYLRRFLRTRIEPSGRFRFDERSDRFQMFDTGDFLTTLAKYWWYTRDARPIQEHREAIGRVLRFIRETRARSLEAFPPDDPRHGMIEGILNNDINKEVTYYYTTDASIWNGLRNFAQALHEIGTAERHKEYVREASEMAAYADEYYDQLRRSFASAVERQDGRISFIHIHPVAEDAAGPVMCKFRTKMGYRAHRRFHEWPRLIGSGYLNDAEVRALFDYESKHEQTVLGVRRYVPRVLDNFQTNEAAHQKLRLGLVREFLMEYYGYIHLMLAPGMWSGFEQVQVVPLPGDRGRYTGPSAKLMPVPRLSGWEGAHATWPVATMTKQIFAFDEPGGGAVWLAAGVPRHWLQDGQRVAASRIPTRYGRIDLGIRYQPEARTLRMDIQPEPGRTLPEIRYRARDPQGGRAVWADVVDAADRTERVEPMDDLFVVENVRTASSLTVHFQ